MDTQSLGTPIDCDEDIDVEGKPDFAEKLNRIIELLERCHNELEYLGTNMRGD